VENTPLTYRPKCRASRDSDVYGNVIKEVLA